MATQHAPATWPTGLDAKASSEIDSLYRQHCAQVTRWASRYGAGMDADDVAQEVFLVASRRLHEFRGDAKLSTWLVQITRRLVSARRRKQSVRERLLRERVQDFETTDAPEDTLHRRRMVAALLPVMQSIPTDQREALWLFEVEGLSCAEIAEAAGTTVENVWVRISRARKRLKQAMDSDAPRAKHVRAQSRRVALYSRHASVPDTRAHVAHVPGPAAARSTLFVRG